MKVQLTAGAEIDTLTSEELRAELAAFKSGMIDGLRKQRPIVIIAQGNVTLDATGAGVIAFNPSGPGLGDAWDVRRVTVTGQDPSVATAGAAYVYRGSDPTVSSPYNFVDTGAIPNVGVWGQHQFTVRNDEQVYIRIKGGVAGTVIFATIQALAEPAQELFGLAAI